MRFSFVILAVALASFLGACGGESETAQGDEDLQAKVNKYLAAPTVDIPDGPPPKKLVVKDLKVGSGAVAKWGDGVRVYFRCFLYIGGKEHCFHWRPSPPSTFKRLGSLSKEFGLHRGIEGMREGGRRELIIPAHLAFEKSPLIYVVELVSVKPAGQSRGAS